MQIEFEKREWSIERERLSMDLDDVTRELELQKMILNGENISEIVQRVRRKNFFGICFVLFVCLFICLFTDRMAYLSGKK